MKQLALLFSTLFVVMGFHASASTSNPYKWEKDNGGYVLLILCLTLGTYLLYQYIIANREDKYWQKGLFPPKKKFKRDTLIEAYIRLGARMIQTDTEEIGKKMGYMVQYFNRYFHNVNYDLEFTIRHAYRHPVQLKSTSSWIKKHIPNKSMRIQVLYFLAGLAYIDGSIQDSERRILAQLTDYLDLTLKDLESVIGMYDAHYNRTQENENTNKESALETARKIAAKILGVSPYASSDEIKKAYRQLVKLHHPDRFISASQEQQKIAEQRFIEIQKAYEFFEQQT